jgi:hypothetical protein
LVLGLDEAAIMLGVDPETVMDWDTRFGYPRRITLADGRWGYSPGDVIALRVRLDLARRAIKPPQVERVFDALSFPDDEVTRAG